MENQEQETQPDVDSDLDEHGIEEEEELEDQHAEQESDGQQPAEQEESAPAVPQYDEETQALVDEARQAREQYQDIERTAQVLRDEIHKLEERSERDYGPDEEFAVLDGSCFEYADLEYVYSLCPFGRASQRSKSGGTDVSLGNWSEWLGEGDAKYTKAKYDRGLTCWNGPARSTIVTLKCGTKDALLSVSEPSRCEYAMEFTTPAVCNIGADGTDVHDEL